jgi:4-alpha-glucanotransferase
MEFGVGVHGCIISREAEGRGYTKTLDPHIAALAAAHGIETEYEDVWGRKHTASDATVQAILRALAAAEQGIRKVSEPPAISGPERVHSVEGRMAGLAISLYGLRSRRNWGCGDFTDLQNLTTEFARAGAHFIALNPLHAIANRQPYNISPYLPLCALYRNYLYLDVERVGDLGTSANLDAEIQREIEALRGSEFVEYERVAELKLRVLRRLFAGFLAAGGSHEFQRFVDDEGTALLRFATFQALYDEMHRRDPNVWVWADWPEEYRDPTSAAVHGFERDHADQARFYQWVQWQVDRQLAEAQAHALAEGMRIGLYHDLALATDRVGCDLWAFREFYVPGCRVGSPPDEFSPKGQDWAFPPPNREAHRASGYELFAQLIRKNARHGGALRIDHVMRFFRLYWIPDGMDATEGAYVRDYPEDLLRVLARESAGESTREKFVVIGEDLGTVTEEVRKALAASGVLSCRLLWFERNADGTFRGPDEYPHQAAVSSSTHDLATLSGFFSARDITARHEAGLIDDAAAQQQYDSREHEKKMLAEALERAGFADDPLGFLLSTPCALAVINQEDLTGELDQQNLPASTWQHPNWRRKMRVAVEELGGVAEEFERLVKRSER